MRRTNTDTADRLRNCDLLLVDGKPMLVTDITIGSKPGLLEVSVCDPNGSLADLDAPTALPVYAGDTVTFRPGNTHLTNSVGIRPGGPANAIHDIDRATHRPAHNHAFGTSCHSRCRRWGKTATAADWFRASVHELPTV